MPNPVSSVSSMDDSASSDGSKKSSRQRKKHQFSVSKQTFSEILVSLQANLLNFSDMAQQLQEEHDREVQSLKWQMVQMRKELKLAGAIRQTLSNASLSSNRLRTLSQASGHENDPTDRMRNSAELANTAPQSDRLEEAKKRRSDRGLAVLQAARFHGASSGKKQAARQSTTESFSTLSTASPGGGAWISEKSYDHTFRAPTQTEWKLTQPPAMPSDGMPTAGGQLLTPLDSVTAKSLPLADAPSTIDIEWDGASSFEISNDMSQSKESEAKSLETFKLHETWTLMTQEISVKPTMSFSRSRKKSSHSMLKRGSIRSDLDLVQDTASADMPSMVRMLTMHPESTIRICWDLTGMLFLGYDFVTVPLQTFGEIYADSETSSSVAIAGLSFWSLDILVSLRTGFLQKEVVVLSPWLILLNYAKTWMLLDIFLVALDWVVISSGDSKSAAGSARMLKFLRVFRLLRLRKVMNLISKVEGFINSNLTVLLLSLFKYVIVLVMLNHLVACLWYSVGVSTNGWTNDTSGILQEDMLYRYLTALHWSITQFHGAMEVTPSNTLERFTAVIVLVASMIGNAAFISTVTNKMIQAQTLRQEKTQIQQSFRTYLRDHQVSLSLSLRLKNAISNVHTDKQSRQAEEKLFALIPHKLLLQLHLEIRGPAILHHGFLQRMSSAHQRPTATIISSAVQDLQFSTNSVVFQTGEVGKSMYFITGGEFVYTFDPNKDFHKALSGRSVIGFEEGFDLQEQRLTKRQQISEAPLWVHWVYVGTLKSVGESENLILDAEGFRKIVQTSFLFQSDASEYARSFHSHLEHCANEGDTITDCVTVPDFGERSSTLSGAARSSSDLSIK